MTTNQDDMLRDRSDMVLRRLLDGGATDAKVVARAGQDLSVRVRLDEVELVEEAGTCSIAVRAFKGKRVATSSTNDLTPDGLDRLVRDALELCDLSQEDPYAGLPDPAELTRAWDDLGLHDPACDGVDADDAVRRCQRAESAARSYDPRINNSEGASFGRTSGAFYMATSGGFRAAPSPVFAGGVVRLSADYRDPGEARVFDLSGRMVARTPFVAEAGRWVARWNTADASRSTTPGVYFVRAGGHSARVVLLAH